MTKRQLAEQLTPANISEMALEMETFGKQLYTRMYGEMKSNVHRLESEVQWMYPEALDDAAKMQMYFDETWVNFAEMAKEMDVWRMPVGISQNIQGCTVKGALSDQF